MLTWNSLTKSQKRWVENVSKILPDCVTNGYITATQCYDSFKLLEKQRVSGSPKIGYPNWLFKLNKIKRGIYLFPAEGVTVQKASQSLSGKAEPIVITNRVSEEDKSFLNDLKAFGIDIKVS
jgi:hypothetical protein